MFKRLALVLLVAVAGSLIPAAAASATTSAAQYFFNGSCDFGLGVHNTSSNPDRWHGATVYACNGSNSVYVDVYSSGATSCNDTESAPTEAHCSILTNNAASTVYRTHIDNTNSDQLLSDNTWSSSD